MYVDVRREKFGRSAGYWRPYRLQIHTFLAFTVRRTMQVMSVKAETNTWWCRRLFFWAVVLLVPCRIVVFLVEHSTSRKLKHFQAVDEKKKEVEARWNAALSTAEQESEMTLITQPLGETLSASRYDDSRLEHIGSRKKKTMTLGTTVASGNDNTKLRLVQKPRFVIHCGPMKVRATDGLSQTNLSTGNASCCSKLAVSLTTPFLSC